jgi:AP-2 complex subunit mu-1
MTFTAPVQLVVLFTEYFNKVKEKNIRDNFVLIYELLDECCDNGVPQITEPSVLKEYIFQKGTFLADKKEFASDVTLQVTGALAHRNPRTSYKKNEVYLDIVETTHVLMATDGAHRLHAWPFPAGGAHGLTREVVHEVALFGVRACYLLALIPNKLH